MTSNHHHHRVAWCPLHLTGSNATGAGHGAYAILHVPSMLIFAIPTFVNWRCGNGVVLDYCVMAAFSCQNLHGDQTIANDASSI